MWTPEIHIHITDLDQPHDNKRSNEKEDEKTRSKNMLDLCAKLYPKEKEYNHANETQKTRTYDM